jgi:hypothetical protein
MIKASMYFAYGRDARPGLAARTTFEAILAGERTSTTRFPAWPGHERWARIKPGDAVRFYEDRAMQGRFVDCVVTAPPAAIDLATCDAATLAAWSQAEGWSESAGRGYGRRYGSGLQIRYRRVDAAGEDSPSAATTKTAQRPQSIFDF